LRRRPGIGRSDAVTAPYSAPQIVEGETLERQIMTTRMNRALRLCLTSLALGGLIAFAFVPTATAQWLPPWRAASPGEIERSLEAQGYGLIAPLVRRPGIYLADVSAGPAGYQRLVVDARSGQILERFMALGAPGRVWGPALAARDEEFGEPPPPGVGSPGFSGRPATAPAAKKSYGGSTNVHIPAAVSPYGAGEAPGGTKPKAKSASTEREPATTKPPSNPPLPPPAPREAATDGSGSQATKSVDPQDSHQPKIGSRPTEVDNVPPAAAPTTQGSSAEASDKPKVSIVPPGLFE
jgi:hypothetical protein